MKLDTNRGSPLTEWVDNIGVGVIEARWFHSLNTSVRSTFDNLSEVWTKRTSGYHYEMFNDAAALREIMLRVSNKPGIRAMYLAGHGKKNAIYGSNNKAIRRVQLRNMLRETAANGCRKTKGLFIGCCDFLNESNAHFILKGSPERENPIIWLAGYSKSPDWIEGNAIDTFFFNNWVKQSTHGGESHRIIRVAQEIDAFMPGACRKYGFNIYVRRPGDNGIQALLTGGR